MTGVLDDRSSSPHPVARRAHRRGAHPHRRSAATRLGRRRSVQSPEAGSRRPDRRPRRRAAWRGALGARADAIRAGDVGSSLLSDQLTENARAKQSRGPPRRPARARGSVGWSKRGSQSSGDAAAAPGPPPPPLGRRHGRGPVRPGPPPTSASATGARRRCCCACTNAQPRPARNVAGSGTGTASAKVEQALGRARRRRSRRLHRRNVAAQTPSPRLRGGEARRAARSRRWAQVSGGAPARRPAELAVLLDETPAATSRIPPANQSPPLTEATTALERSKAVSTAAWRALADARDASRPASRQRRTTSGAATAHLRGADRGLAVRRPSRRLATNPRRALRPRRENARRRSRSEFEKGPRPPPAEPSAAAPRSPSAKRIPRVASEMNAALEGRRPNRFRDAGAGAARG